MLTILLLSILAAIVVGSPAAESGTSAMLGATLLATVVVPVVLAGVSVVVYRRSEYSDRIVDIWLKVHAAIWAGLSVALVQIGHWPDFVRSIHLFTGAILLDELVILSPVLISWLLSWLLFADFFAESANRSRGWRWGFVANQLRLTLLLAWAPVLLFCGLMDVTQWLLPELPTTTSCLVVFSANLLVLAAGFPILLSSIWNTTSLSDGPLRSTLMGMAAGKRLGLGDIRIWNTDQQVMNAAIAGILPGTKRVFLSDALVTRLSDDEIQAAFAHEMGHACRRHALWRTAIVLAPLAVAAGFSVFFPAASDWLETAKNLTFAASMGYMFVALGWYSHRLEHEADLWACQFLVERGRDARDVLELYLGVLAMLCDPQHVRRSSWLHPSLKRRRDFLVRQLSNRRSALAFQREMQWIACILATTLIVSVGLFLGA